MGWELSDEVCAQFALKYPGQGLGGSEGAEAFLGGGVVAGRPHAGGAGKVEAHDAGLLAVGAGAAWFGGAKQGQQRLAQGGGGVHGAGVVGNHQVAAADPFDHLE